MKLIKKILIANRGEIAIRVLRTAKTMGIATVAVYSDADRDALYVKVADEAIAIGGNHASESYLDVNKILAAAKQVGADAIHPGYGFLSENAGFAKRCKEDSIIFIGPSADAITAMGSKIGAKELMIKAGVPVVPGYQGADQSVARLQKEAEQIGYPILLKASAGGGGKGMRIVNKVEELATAIEGASRESEKYFGNGSLLIEKYFASAKHIEFQIFGDEHGNYTHFFDRECSLQRRYQKVIEESPSPSLSGDLRKKMGDAAVAAARAIGYSNAGTVEFLLDKAGNFYFLEVNTRLQVEHPVTEETTGLDLVRLQIEVAQGMPLTVNSENTQQVGHAIECRICAEDPENNFLPDTGTIEYWNAPLLSGIRYDSGVRTGSKVDIYYDSLLAKVIATGTTRSEAIQRMMSALDQMSILGITTNKDFLKELLRHPAYIDGSFDTKLIEREFSDYKKVNTEQTLHEIAIATMLWSWSERSSKETFSHSLNGWRNLFYQSQLYELTYNGEKITVAYRYLQQQQFEVSIGEKQYQVEWIDRTVNEINCVINSHRQTFCMAKNTTNIFIQHPIQGAYRLQEVARYTEPKIEDIKGGYIASMPGEVVRVLVAVGDRVQSGKGLLVLSSMKMETTIEAQADGKVEEIFVAERQFVEAGMVMIKLATDN